MLTQLFLHMLAFAATAVAAPDTPDSLRAEAYVAAQGAMLSEAGDALNKVAARFGRGDDAIATLERRRESDVQALAAVDKRLATLLGQASSATQAERALVTAERDRLRASVAEIDRKIDASDPAYGELTRPRPLDLTATQALLRADEGLVLIFPTPAATYMFSVTHEHAAWSRAAITSAEVDTSVMALRNSMIADLTTGSETFDRMRAFTLYDQLIRPIEGPLAHKRAVMIVTAGSLGTLPLQLLVTEKPADSRTDDAAMRNTHWLVDRYALATLPAISSLRALRCLLVPASKRAAGCDTPTNASGARRQPVSRPPVQLVGFGAPLLAPPVAADRGASRIPQVRTVYQGGIVDTKLLRSLPSLPGARAELEMVSRIFGAGSSEIDIGAAATEAKVKTSTTLPAARLVIFSTHGLLASESRLVGASEPGLVFTPPADGAGTELDDGFLTASEAAKLKLDADLVVLSACNTAASDGTPGANGLSGLARSFFFAGAHRLVVSNWSVSDEATSLLMSKIFAAAKQREDVRFSDVLQRAAEDVRATPNFAAPAFWAPFILVGTTE